MNLSELFGMMKVFQLFRVVFDSLSLHPPKSSIGKYRIDLKRIVIFYFNGGCIIPLWLYFLFEANTFSEYADSFYAVATATLLAFIYFILHRNIQKVFELMDDIEYAVQKRELICTF